jgi:hypothetical protein
MLGKDFFPLPTIASGTLKDAHTYLLSVNGCVPGGAYDPAAQNAGVTCGPGDAGPWIGIDPMDTTTAVPDGGIGFQFLNRSSALQFTPICVDGTVDPVTGICSSGSIGVPNGGYAETPVTNGLNPDIVTLAFEDAGPDAAATPVVTPLPLSPAAPVLYANSITPVTVATITPSNLMTSPTTFFGIITTTHDGGAPNIVDPTSGYAGFSNLNEWPISDTIPVPASAVLASSGWTASTGTSSSPDGQFHNGASYTLVWMGDPTWNGNNTAGTILSDGGLNPAYDGRGLHLVAFPNVFTPIPAPGN